MVDPIASEPMPTYHTGAIPHDDDDLFDIHIDIPDHLSSTVLTQSLDDLYARLR